MPGQHKNIEVRNVSVSANVETRKGKSGSDSRVIIGTAVVYNSLSEDMGFREKISPGAFTQSLKDNEVLFYYAHNSEKICGRQSNGTLEISDRTDGLHFRLDTAPVSWGDDLLALIRRKDIHQMSFGFAVPDGGDIWEQLSDGTVLRTVKQALLYEISAVGQPAYSASSVALASRNAPSHIRESLKRSADDEKINNDDADADDDCLCECEACVDDNCADCTMPDCDDERCSAADCPAQLRSLHVAALCKRRVLLEDLSS